MLITLPDGTGKWSLVDSRFPPELRGIGWTHGQIGLLVEVGKRLDRMRVLLFQDF